VGVRWGDFPASVRNELESYLDGLRHRRRLRVGRKAPPCAESTIETRRRELVAFAHKAVALGADPQTLTSFSALLALPLVRRVLEAYWQEDGARPETYTIDLPRRLYVVARETGCLDEMAIEELAELRQTLEHHRRPGLTDKNRTLIRRVKTTDIWQAVVDLPKQLMAEAKSARVVSPVKSAVKAQIATAIAVLTFAPVRIGNLARTRLDENLARVGGPEGNFWLNYPAAEVKNT
jgi:hypothetical protein